MIYAARLLGGFFSGGGGYVIVPLFIAEISDDKIRGFLTSTHVLTENLGILIAYVIGAFFDFYAIPLCAIIFAIASGILIYFLPETPLFLVKQNKITVNLCKFLLFSNVQIVLKFFNFSI